MHDDFSAHTYENIQTGHLEPLTATGRFFITLLQLNRSALVDHRLRRSLAALLAAKQGILEAENAQLRVIIAAQETYVAHLRQLLGLPG
jgi:hypothetical protein